MTSDLSYSARYMHAICLLLDKYHVLSTHHRHDHGLGKARPPGLASKSTAEAAPYHKAEAGSATF